MTQTCAPSRFGNSTVRLPRYARSGRSPPPLRPCVRCAPLRGEVKLPLNQEARVHGHPRTTCPNYLPEMLARTAGRHPAWGQCCPLSVWGYFQPPLYPAKLRNCRNKHNTCQPLNVLQTVASPHGPHHQLTRFASPLRLCSTVAAPIPSRFQWQPCGVAMPISSHVMLGT